MKFLRKDKINAEDIFNQSYAWLQEKYNTSKNILTTASPFTQILKVLSEISELIFFYIESASSEWNFITAKNPTNVKGLARLVGHNATRGITASGKVSLKMKPGINGNYAGDYFFVYNYTNLTCLNNGLNYFLFLNVPSLKIEKNSILFQQCEILQGEIDRQTFVSNGKPLQSFSITTSSFIDHNFIKVYVNNEVWGTEESLYDINYDEKKCLIKTGITGGIDIFFGNTNFGLIPASGALIEVEYIKTQGELGNLVTNTDIQFKFKDTGFDQFGEEVDLNENVLLNVDIQPSFGTNSEDIEFTRLIAPKTSKSFILARPENYVYFLSKYSFFSYIDAYNTYDDRYIDDDNVIYLFLIPDIRKKLETSINYFTVPTDQFLLSDIEQEKIEDLIWKSGQQLITSELVFVKPKLKKYVLNIVLKYFNTPDKSTIYNNIMIKLSEYFTTIHRRDSIPKSDIVALLENVDGVDSVSVFFNSEENEQAIANGYYIKDVYGYNENTKRRELIESKKVTLNPGEDPNIGLDEMGDIVLEKEDIAIIRGGFYDRKNNYYEEYPYENKLGSVNIFFKRKIDRTVLTDDRQTRFKQLN